VHSVEISRFVSRQSGCVKKVERFVECAKKRAVLRVMVPVVGFGTRVMRVVEWFSGLYGMSVATREWFSLMVRTMSPAPMAGDDGREFVREVKAENVIRK
jgi:hypothetical protein